MELIEVKAQEQQQRRGERHQQEGASDDRATLASQKDIDRRQPRKTHRTRLAGRLDTLNKAGSRVMLVRNAMIMPQPAIWPSSERPR
jgi:hypothetical protein